MSELKRYLNWCQPTHGHAMLETDDGPWVLFEDYERLMRTTVNQRNELARLTFDNNHNFKATAKLQIEIERLRAALENIIATESVDNDGEPVPETGACFLARRALQEPKP